MNEPGQETPFLLALFIGHRGDRSATAGITDAQWMELLDLARRHQVSVLLHRRLQQRNWYSRVPDTARAMLLAAARRGAARSLLLHAGLRHINHALTAAAVPFLVLKGAHLAHAIYESPELREMIDLDILVPRDAVRRAVDALESAGYRASTPYVLDSQVDQHHHLTPLIRNSVAVEVHWELFPARGSSRVGTGSLFDTATTVTVDGERLRGLSLEDLLVHLCVHAARHHVFALGIRALVDIDQLLARHAEIDWSRVRGRARERSAWREVALTVLLAHDLLGTPLPASLMQSIQGDCDSRIRRLAMRRILAPPPAVSEAVARFAVAPLRWSTVRAMLAQLFSRGQIARTYGLPVNSPRVLLHYPAWMLDILRRHGAKVLTWTLGDSDAKRSAREQLALMEWLEGTGPAPISKGTG